MPKIEPTVGRVVYYRPHHSENIHTSDEPLAALVAAVCPDGRLNLTVSDAFGRTHDRQGVVLVQDGEKPPPRSYCEWMPFQKGQAAKTTNYEQLLEIAVATLSARLEALEATVSEVAASTSHVRGSEAEAKEDKSAHKGRR